MATVGDPSAIAGFLSGIRDKGMPDEPPPWIYPVRQSLAVALLRNGQAKEAEAVFREAMVKRPRDGRLLFGLQLSLLAQGRNDEAALVEVRFNTAWKDATVKLGLEDL